MKLPEISDYGDEQNITPIDVAGAFS